MKTKLIHSKVVPQDCIVVGNDEIKGVKEYVYLELTISVCQDMDSEILQRIRSDRKTFTTIKDRLEAKLDKALYVNFFNRKQNVGYHKERRTETG